MSHRAKCLERGKCPSHPSRGIVPGRTMCQECLDSQIKRREELLKQGKCSNCSGALVPGKTLCQKCLDKMKEYSAERTQDFIAKGKCINHPNNNILPGKTICQECVNRNREYRESRRKMCLEKGVCCYCFVNPIVPNKRGCKECLTNIKIYDKYKREEYLKNGRCPRHPSINIIPGYKQCQICIERGREKHNLKRKNSKCSKCFINVPLPGKTICIDCFNKRLREKQTTKICSNCQTRPRLPNKKYCHMCIIEMDKEKKQIIGSGNCMKCLKNKKLSNKLLCAECMWKTSLQRYRNTYGISEQEVENKLISQNYTCPVSGIKLIKGVNISLDHKSPINGETLRTDKEHPLNNVENLQFMDWHVNNMKNSFSTEEFIDICLSIIKHQIKLGKIKKEDI